MASLQAKIIWKRPRKRENKNYRVVTFLTDALQKIPKKQQKNKKKFHYGVISSQKQFGKGKEREKIKIIVSFRPYLTHNLKFQKNYKKIRKIKKSHFGLILSQNSLEKNDKERK